MPDLDKMTMDEYKAARNGTAVAKPEPKDDDKPADTAPPKDDAKPKVSGGWQKRIDRLTKHNSTLEAQLEAARKEAEALRSGKKEEPKAAPADEEPKRESFASDAEYMKAMIDFGVSRKLAAEKLAEQRRQEDARIKEVFDAYNRRLSEARSLHDDFDEVINQDTQIPQAVQLAIFEMENGPEVVYFLGQHPEICEELMEMSQFQAIGKVWRISEGLEPDKEEEETKEKEEPKAKAKEEEKPKAKFAPIKPVSSGSTGNTKALDQLSMADYKKARAAGRVS